MKTYQEYQQELLETIKSKIKISQQTQEAFLQTPRHLFAKQFLKYTKGEGDQLEYELIKLTDKILQEHLDHLYKNGTICLALDKEGEYWLSSISQPSLVLMMLDKLDIQKGQNILEIGTASGWNAAMMAHLVGNTGEVHSVEIISELVPRAQASIDGMGITNVSLYDADGALQEYDKTFDRIMFTVGSYDIPLSIHQQLKEGGLLLMVLKNRANFDTLILFKKEGKHLHSINSIPCGFVPLQGAYEMPELNTKSLNEEALWQELKDQVVKEQNFWWGSNFSPKGSRFFNKVSGVISFLSVVAPHFEYFQTENEEKCFGLIDKASASIALWQNDKLTAYGNTKAYDQLKEYLHLYTDLGMPSSSCFKVKAYPIDETVELQSNQWLIKRKDTQFLWYLE